MLNAEVKRGRIRHLAASNWSVSRLAEANAYARSHQLQPFVLSQPRWSLASVAHEADPLVIDMDESAVAWHRQSQFPAAPYTPTAQGFFAGRTGKAYDTPENRQRRDRATELAQKHGVAPSQIALAWLTHQPFPVFPILGTTNVERLREALASDALRLTEEEIAWLTQG